MKRSRHLVARLLVVLALVAPAPVLAQSPPPNEDETHFLRGPELRYDEANVFVRILADIPAVPVSIADWQPWQWATAGGVTAAVGGLMLPLDPPPDLRLDTWMAPHVDPWMPDIWAMKWQIPFWTTLAASGLSTWGFSALLGETEITETMSLVAESLAVTQFYHLTIKLSLGREDETGKLRGFPESLNQFPEGTPGGHFATIYAFYGAIEAYWDPGLAIRIGMHSLLATLALTHVLNHRHYLSDQIFGAALGYSISHWVVRNRSSRFQFDREGEPLRVRVVPMPRGLGLAGTF